VNPTHPGCEFEISLGLWDFFRFLVAWLVHTGSGLLWWSLSSAMEGKLRQRGCPSGYGSSVGIERSPIRFWLSPLLPIWCAFGFGCWRLPFWDKPAFHSALFSWVLPSYCISYSEIRSLQVSSQAQQLDQKALLEFVARSEEKVM
jgi:hypothetical protein